MTDNVQRTALSAAHRALHGVTYGFVGLAQEAALEAIMAKMPDSFENERIHAETNESGVSAEMKIRVDPTKGNDDAFEMVYIGTLKEGLWTFLYSHSSDLKE